MFSFELWMLPGVLLLTAVGLVAAGYLWGVALDIKQRLTDATGDDSEEDRLDGC